MTLQEFLAESHRSIDNFGLLWLQRNKEQPQNFPLELESGDWWEQLLTFETNESDTL